MKHLHPVFLSLIALFGLTSCLDQIKLSSYSIQYPIAGKSYVGTEYNASPNDLQGYEKLGEHFIVNSSSSFPQQTKMVLNGNDVGEYFELGDSPKQLKADIRDIQQFLKQGRNTFSVEPLSFGPQVVFDVDIHGPSIILTESNYSYIQEGVDGDGQPNMVPDSVRIHGFLRDASKYGSFLTVETIQVEGHDINGNVLTVPQDSFEIKVNEDGSFVGDVTIYNIIEPELWKNVSTDDEPDIYPVWQYTPGKSLLYTLRVSDIHGYETTMNIMADVAGSNDSLPINNALRLAIGDSFVESLRPVIAAGLTSALEKNPISGSDLGPFKVDIGLGNMPTTVDYFHLAKGDELTNPDPNSPGKVDWSDINDGAGPDKARINLNSFKVKDGSILAVDMVITSVLAELTIEMPSSLSWLIPRLELGMYIERINVETDAFAQAAQGKVSVQLRDSNFALQGIQTTDVKAGALDVTALAGALIPLLEGVIGGLLPTLVNPVIADNLSRIVIGQRLYRTDLIPGDIDKTNLPNPNSTKLTDEEKAILARLEANVPYTDFRVDVFELDTDTVLPPYYDLRVGIQSKADTGKADSFVKPILGTYFSDDPINPSLVMNGLGETGSNISMAINSNLINQFLAGVYSIGQMHLTLHPFSLTNLGGGKLYLGADHALTPVDPDNPTQTLAVKGDSRMRLWPDMPPIFAMQNIADSGSTGKGSITYPSATLAIEKFDGSKWNNEISLQVEFDLAVLVDELEGAVTLGAAGPPVFKVHETVNNTNVHISDLVLQAVIDATMFFGGDAIADQVIPINLNDIANATVNGKRLPLDSTEDVFTLADGSEAGKPQECAIQYAKDEWGKCPVGDDSCNPADNPIAFGASDDKLDTICYIVNFEVQTDTVGTIGDKGSNLFFQMGARDPSIPPAPAVPRLDLDVDGVVDYRDNCSINQAQLASIIGEVSDVHGQTLEANLDVETGELQESYKTLIRQEANKMVAIIYGGSAAAVPSSEDITWYNSNMRVADNPVTDLGEYPWLRLLFSNESQFDSDKDRIGELCEDDRDRDGIYADNLSVSLPDNCPSVYNPDQFDTLHPSGVGDACNARSTFVMLRSLKSKQDSVGGNSPLCLAQPASVSSNTTNVRDMLPCDASDPRQRFYMKAVNGVNLNEGVEFYTNASRSQGSASRLVAFGREQIDNGCETWLGNTGGTYTWVEEVKLVNRDDVYVKDVNDDKIGNAACSGTRDRIDPIWYPRRAPLVATDSLEDTQYPWYIDTKFDFYFRYNDGERTTAEDRKSCLTYGAGFGVDLDHLGPVPDKDPQQFYCSEGSDWRWAIWVGGADAPWNGEW